MKGGVQVVGELKALDDDYFSFKHTSVQEKSYSTMYIAFSQIAEVRSFVLPLFEKATRMGSTEVIKRLFQGMNVTFKNDTTTETFYEYWRIPVIYIFRTIGNKWYILHPRDENTVMDIPYRSYNQN